LNIRESCFDCIDGNHEKCIGEWGIGHICDCSLTYHSNGLGDEKNG